jgi:hypothetical protein
MNMLKIDILGLFWNTEINNREGDGRIQKDLDIMRYGLKLEASGKR